MVAAGAALTGTVCVHELPALPGMAFVVPASLIGMLALRHRASRPLLWFLAAVISTAFRADGRLDDRLAASNLGRDFAITGIVADFPTAAPRQAAFGFVVAAPRPPGVPARLRLTWYDPPQFRAGDSLRLTVRLRPPRGARNPGGSDYERWLLVNAVGATGYVREGGVASPSEHWRARWLRFRAGLAERLAAGARTPDGAALLVALALGERHLFSEQHWSDFRRTGTSHLVAVSGMHVALLGMLAFVVVRAACRRLPSPAGSFDLETAAVVSLVVTAYYAALTGFAVPAQRSLVMIAAALVVLVSRRLIGVPQTLAATLLAVLAWDPFAPLTASFWLSFVAVAVLVALGAPRPICTAAGRGARARAAFGAFIGLQWWIGLALLPLTLWHFGEISLVGPVVNWLAIPWFNVVLVPAALSATIVASFDVLSTHAVSLVQMAGELAAVTVGVLHACAEWPAAAVTMPRPPWPTFALAAAGVAFAVAAPPLSGRRLAWLTLVPMLVPSIVLPATGEARVTVLDVGHGLAVLIETRGHRLLFDAGPTFASGFDTGADVVLPALGARGRRGLDALVVSHADNDHAGGAPAVVAAFPGAAVWKGPDVTALPGRVCERGRGWNWDTVHFRILHPAPGFAGRGNDGSCVLEVATAGGRLLVTADVERRGEGALLGSSLAADVVIVPHHGSATSSSPAFVAAVGARYALVSAGYANRWGFPRPEVRARWQDAGARVLVTGEVGAISVVLGREGVIVTAERDGRHRYWHAPAAEGS